MEEDNSWRNATYRQSVRDKISECATSLPNNPGKKVNDMENHIFGKSNSREEYLSNIARLIIHMREMSRKTTEICQELSEQSPFEPQQPLPDVHPSMLQREHVVKKLNDEISSSALTLNVNTVDVENKIFGQAQSKKEYLGMVASLIIHIRGINSIVGSQPEPKAELNQDDQQQETEDAIMALENISLQNVFP